MPKPTRKGIQAQLQRLKRVAVAAAPPQPTRAAVVATSAPFSAPESPAAVAPTTEPPQSPVRAPGGLDAYHSFLASLTAEGTRRAYQGDLVLFARWWGVTPVVAAQGLIDYGPVQGPALVQRWLHEMRQGGLSLCVCNRRWAALKALVRHAHSKGTCSWLLGPSGLPKTERPTGPPVLRGEALRSALGTLRLLAPVESLVELAQPAEVPCRLFTKER